MHSKCIAVFLKGNKASWWVTQHFHAFDGGDGFICIEVDMMVKHEFSVKEET